MEEIESCLAKLRWERGRKDRAKEDERVAEEMGEDAGDTGGEVRRHPFDLLKNDFDMSFIRPTDMRANKHVIMPNP